MDNRKSKGCTGVNNNKKKQKTSDTAEGSNLFIKEQLPVYDYVSFLSCIFFYVYIAQFCLLRGPFKNVCVWGRLPCWALEETVLFLAWHEQQQQPGAFFCVEFACCMNSKAAENSTLLQTRMRLQWHYFYITGCEPKSEALKKKKKLQGWKWVPLPLWSCRTGRGTHFG